MRQTSGSLGCLDDYNTVSSTIEVEGDSEKHRSLVCSETGNSATNIHGSRALAGERTVTWAEPRIKVIPPTTGRSVLMAMHTEYTR